MSLGYLWRNSHDENSELDRLHHPFPNQLSGGLSWRLVVKWGWAQDRGRNWEEKEMKSKFCLIVKGFAVRFPTYGSNSRC